MKVKEQQSIPVGKVQRATKFISTGAKIGTNYLKHYAPADGSSYVFTKNMMPCGWASWSKKSGMSPKR